MSYEEILGRRRQYSQPCGFLADAINPMLFDFQRDVTKWALKRGKAAIFQDCGMGKGNPEGTVILTPSGFVPNTDLEVGDLVVASDGSAYPLHAKYLRGKQDTFRVHFSDGCSFVVDAEHLHILRTNNDRQRGKPWRVVSTKQLLRMPIRYGDGKKSRNIDIPVVYPVRGEKINHWIHPYVLGVLLGDGCITKGCVLTVADEQILNTVRAFLPEGFTLKRRSRYDYALSRGGTNGREFITELRRLGIHGKRSGTKFIPPEYMLDSIENRVWLLRGLMDTDGYIGSSSQFYSTSARLADDALMLIRSLGGVPTHTVKNTSCIHKGTRRTGAPCHILTFSLKTFNPFHLARKAAQWNPNPRDNGRWIDRVEACGRQNTICLSVGSPDQSYVTENYIVTHNTPEQLEWSQKVHKHENKPVLIFAPLAVTQQTKREGDKFGVPVTVCRKQLDVTQGVNVANYEMLDHFDSSAFCGLVCDESSILKGYNRTTRQKLTEFARFIPYRLSCTATPAPNDFMELGTQAEFLGIMKRTEMLSMFFIHDGGDTSQWRLKGHGANRFWEWVASWAVYMRKPSDLGYENDGFTLPPLRYHQHTVAAEWTTDYLFPVEAKSMQERRAARRDSLEQRVKFCADIVNDSKEQWVVWCGLNPEGEALGREIIGAVEVAGRHPIEYKEEAALGFKDGRIRVIVSKPSIFGWGLNWEHCHNMAFVGLSDSWEELYQATRRCWRFGQQNPVDVHIITGELEGAIVRNIQRKEAQAAEMAGGMLEHMKAINSAEIHGATRDTTEYIPKTELELPCWL